MSKNLRICQKEEFRRKDKMKIIIISLAGIGDGIMASPTIKAIKEHYKEATIDALVFPYGFGEVLEGYLNNIYIFTDKTHTLTSKKPSFFRTIQTFFLLTKLRFKKYDLSVSVHPSSSPKLAFMAKFINAKRRVGFDSKNYTIPVRLNKKLHKVERNFELLKPLGIEIKDKKQYFHISEENEKFAKEFLRDKGNLFIGIHPGGYWKRQTKKWSLERFGKLADKLTKDFGAKILVFEGPSEGGDGERMEKYMETKLIKVRTDLKNAAAIIKKCGLFISNDTGMMHIAEAMDVPVIDILGWAELASGPYYEKNKKLIASENLSCHNDNCPVLASGGKTNPKCNLECFKGIKVEDVFKLAKGVLR